MSRAAESVRRYSNFFKIQNVLNVLDYGTGTMRNAIFMANQGFRVYAADLPDQVEKLRTCPALKLVEQLFGTDSLPEANLNVDLVISTYVFNIIMNHQERYSYIENAVKNLRYGGYLLIEVRCPKPEPTCGSGCKAYFSCDECAKALTHDELDILLTPHGLRRISHYYRSHAVSAIYRKDE